VRPCRCHNFSCGRCEAKPCCAICAGEITGIPQREPLGRDNALVNVCASCSQPVIAKTGPDRSYEPSGGSPSKDDARRAWAPMGRFVR
jgi:ribosome-binding protein aMBF1 (putative translation factor)